MRDGGELIGFAPLFCWGVEAPTVSFLGAGISDYGDLLFAPGCEKRCSDALWKFLDQQKTTWHVIDLQEVRGESALLEGQKVQDCSVQKCSVCPVLDLATWPGSMDSRQRTDWRRALNRLRKNSELRFEMTGDIGEFLRLYEARWGAMDGALQRFHREAAAQFCASGLLRLGVVRIDGGAAAAVYGFRTGDTLYCYLSGFDPAMAKQSPGAVLLGWMIEQAVAEGIKEVDFLRHPESYKYLWGARDRVNYRVGSYTESSVKPATNA